MVAAVITPKTGIGTDAKKGCDKLCGEDEEDGYGYRISYIEYR